MSNMNERDVYEIDFNLGPAEEKLNAFFTRLDAAEGRIIAIFSRIETAAVGSLGKSAAELQNLSKVVQQSLDAIDKKAGRGRKPIVIVDKKDVDAAAENLNKVGDSVDKLTEQVEADAERIQDALSDAFEAPTQYQQGNPNDTTQVLAPIPLPPTVVTPRLADTQVSPPSPATPTGQVYDAGPINEVVAAQERQVDVLRKTDEAAAAAEASYIRFLAAELKAAAGADQFAREQISVFAASRKNAEGFVDSVKALDRLSDGQIQYAEQVATLKNNLKLLRDELNQENVDREAVIGQIERQAAVLQVLEAAQEKEAAQAGKAAELEKLGEEVRGQIYADRLQKQQALQQQQQQAEAQFKRIVRVFAEEGTALNSLAQRYGVFTATVRGSGEATNQLEKELQDIIQQSPRLRQVVQQLTNEVGEFKLNADPSTFKSPQTFLFNPDDIRKLGFALQRFGVNGVAAFGEIYAAIGPAGIALGAFTLGVVALTKTIVSLGKEAVRVFSEILSKSIELARQREVAAAQFKAYLGNAQAAELVLNRIDQISAKLGQDVSGLAQTFLPQVSSIEEFQKVADAAAALALLKPNKTIDDAAVALRELSAGDVTSLRRQFEIPSYVLDNVKKAIDETGQLGEGIKVLNTYFEQTGRTVEDLGGTLEFNLGRGQELLNTFGRDAGKEIVTSLNKNLDEALDLVESKENTLRGFAFGIGTIVSDIVDKIGGIIKTIVASISDEDIASILNAIALAGRTLLTVLTGVEDISPDAATAVGVVSSTIEILFLKIAQLNLSVGAMIDLFGLLSEVALGVVNPSLFAITGGVDDLQRHLDDFFAKSKQLGDIQSYIRGNSDSNPYVGLEDFNRSIQDYIKQISNTDDSLVDAILSDKREQALDDMSEKYKKYTDELKQLQQDLRDRQGDLAIDVSRDIIDFLEEVAQKRVDLATDNKRKLEEIERDYNNDLEDAAREHGYDMEDIEIEAARRRAQQATEFADKRLKIEEDYQRKIAEIRRKYAFDLQEAARQNDAIQYLRLLRQREFDLNEARIKRDEDLGDVDKEVKKQNDENARRRQEDIEDAKLAYKRKLEELEIANEREIEEQNIKYKQEQKDLLLWEERQRAELVTSYKRKLDDLNLYWERRLRDINQKFSEEFDIAQYWASKMLELQNSTLSPLLGDGGSKSRNGRTFTQLGDTAPTAGDTGVGSDTQQSRPTNRDDERPQQTREGYDFYRREVERLARDLGREDIIKNIQYMNLSQLVRAYQNLLMISNRGVGRDTGGHLQANQPALVGRNGKEEVFVPSTSGYMYPVADLYRQPKDAATYNYRYDQRKVNVDLSLLDTQMLNREIASAIRAQVVEIMKDVV